MISRDTFGTPEIKCNPHPDVTNTNRAARPIFVEPNVFMVVMVDVVIGGVTAAIAPLRVVVDAHAAGIIERNDDIINHTKQSNGKVIEIRAGYNDDVDTEENDAVVVRRGGSVIVVVDVVVTVRNGSSCNFDLQLLTVESLMREYRFCGGSGGCMYRNDGAGRNWNTEIGVVYVEPPCTEEYRYRFEPNISRVQLQHIST